MDNFLTKPAQKTYDFIKTEDIHAQKLGIEVVIQFCVNT